MQARLSHLLLVGFPASLQVQHLLAGRIACFLWGHGLMLKCVHVASVKNMSRMLFRSSFMLQDRILAEWDSIIWESAQAISQSRLGCFYLAMTSSLVSCKALHWRHWEVARALLPLERIFSALYSMESWQDCCHCSGRDNLSVATLGLWLLTSLNFCSLQFWKQI